MIASQMSSLAFTLAEGIGLPIEASTAATRTDVVWNTVFWVCLFFFCIVVGVMLFFIVKYRRRPGQQYEAAVTHNTPLEVVWTLVPLVIVLVFFVMGLSTYIFEDEPPSNSYQVDVQAQKWLFNFTYPNGGQSAVLYVPVDTPVELNLTSKDVLHGCYIPAFRVQKNFVPGRVTHLWFQATKTTPKDEKGQYADELGFDLFCNQYCGAGHSQMHTTVVVMDQAAFDAKVAALSNIFVDPATKKPLPLPQVGHNLYSQLCISCHTVDGSPGTGPSWKGVYGNPVTLSTGQTIIANEDYLNRSILQPNADVVQSFTPVMPSFDGQLSGTPYKDEKRYALMSYIMSLSPNGASDLPAFEKAHPVPNANASAAAGTPTTSAPSTTAPAFKQGH